MAIRLIFWISALFVAYTYLLYPLIIVAAAKARRRRPVPDPGTAEPPSVSMIIIAHNEEARIGGKLDNCAELDYPREKLTVYVVSDGSTDGTARMLRDRPDIVFIEDDVNRGKPHQINRAVKMCRGDLVVFSDARQLYEPSALRKLARNFADPSIGAVSGELTFVSPRDTTGQNVGLYWRYEKILRRAESDVDSTLGVTGAIYAIRRELIEEIPDDTILDDIEIPLRAFRKGYRVAFDGEAIAYDAASTAIGSEFRRKVRTLAGNFQLFARNRWLLEPGENRIFLQAVSHKLFRLFVPYFLVSALVASGLAAGAQYRAFFWIQAACYALGTAALASGGLRRYRAINLFSVFISLNAAAVAGLYRYATGSADARWRR